MLRLFDFLNIQRNTGQPKQHEQEMSVSAAATTSQAAVRESQQGEASSSTLTPSAQDTFAAIAKKVNDTRLYPNVTYYLEGIMEQALRFSTTKNQKRSPAEIANIMAGMNYNLIARNGQLYLNGQSNHWKKEITLTEQQISNLENATNAALKQKDTVNNASDIASEFFNCLSDPDLFHKSIYGYLNLSTTQFKNEEDSKDHAIHNSDLIKEHLLAKQVSLISEDKPHNVNKILLQTFTWLEQSLWCGAGKALFDTIEKGIERIHRYNFARPQSEFIGSVIHNLPYKIHGSLPCLNQINYLQSTLTKHLTDHKGQSQKKREKEFVNELIKLNLSPTAKKVLQQPEKGTIEFSFYQCQLSVAYTADRERNALQHYIFTLPETRELARYLGISDQIDLSQLETSRMTVNALIMAVNNMPSPKYAAAATDTSISTPRSMK